MKGYISLLICLLSVMNLSAQDDSQNEYRLRTPTVEEYLAVIPTALERWYLELPAYYGKTPDQPLAYAILDELALRYPQDEVFTQTFDLLSKAFSAFYPIDNVNPVNSDEWIPAIIKAWLRENPVDLSQVVELKISYIFHSKVEAVDFNGDGVDEYILSNEGILVFQRDDSLKEGYRIILIVSFPDDWWSINWRETSSVSLQDITGDGLPEWTLSYGEGGIGGGNNCGNYFILTWRDNHFVQIFNGKWACEGAGGGFSLETVGLDYINLDNDEALEIEQHQNDGNTWGCKWVNTVTYDWDGENYVEIGSKRTVEENFSCEVGRAEQLMWDHNSYAAIPLYETALQAGLGAETGSELNQYVRARLILAYMMVGRRSDARTLLDELEAEPSMSEMMMAMINSMAAADFDTLSLCTAAYNVFDEYESSMFSYGLPTSLMVGRDTEFAGMMDNRPPEAEKAGCDAPAFINGLLNAHIFTLAVSPVDQLEQLGIEIETALNVDMNNDGIDEWLVWLKARVTPLFFASDGKTYHLSRPEIRRPNQYTQITTQPLPDNNGRVIVDWVYLTFNATNAELGYYDVPGYKCVLKPGDESVYRNGAVALWQLAGNELQQMFEVPMCEYREIADIFQNNSRELHLSALQIVDPEQSYQNQYGDAVYTWDETQHTYVAPEPGPEDQSIYLSGVGYIEDSPENQAMLTDAFVFDAVESARSAFEKENYDEALMILEDAMSNHAPDVNNVILYGVYYWRALTLEQLGRVDDALAQYEMIFQITPESSWGILAGLHLEPAES